MKKYVPLLMVLCILILLTAVVVQLERMIRDWMISAPEHETLVTSAPGDTAATAEPLQETPDERSSYLVAVDQCPYFPEPGRADQSPLGALSRGTLVSCERLEGQWMLASFANGEEAWIYLWYLEACDAALAQQQEMDALRVQTERESFVPVEGEPWYVCTASILQCRAEPTDDAFVLTNIQAGTKVAVFGRDGAYLLCRLPGGKCCYCLGDWLVRDGQYVSYPGAVDLRLYLPLAEFELLFASPNNITGHAMYEPIPLLEEETAQHLRTAYHRFREDGYIIKIYDAYRPFSAQVQLYEIVKDSNFIADPSYGGSWHQRGRAVDMSLIEIATGRELEMPTPMHTFNMSAARFQSGNWTEEARRNVEYMTKVMQEAGFGILGTEWWHFEYLEPGNYLDKEIDLASLPTIDLMDTLTKG